MKTISPENINMPKRYLVICTVGTHDSAHKQWIDPARNFDLFLVNYGDIPGLYKEDADRYFEIPGFKLQILAQAIRESIKEVSEYYAVWLPDDDLDGISVTQVNKLFRFFEDYELDLAQPAVANEYFNHIVTHRQPGCRMRFVNFVEMMCPLFRTEVLLDQLHLFSLNQSGMGIDYLWSQNTLKWKLPGNPLYHKNVAIIDEISVVHRKKMSLSGPYYQKLAAMGIDPVRETEQLLADHNLSHVRRHYETYSTMYSHPLGAPVKVLYKAKRWSLDEFPTILRHVRSRSSDLMDAIRSRTTPCTSPVIICGMHRSGTTLLIKILMQLGLFIGEDLEKNLESKIFQDLNMWLMDLGHAHWDYPRPFLKLDQHKAISRELQRRFHKKIGAYLGWQRQFLSLRGIPFRWGWKDPCNTITLPLWLRLYPEAKVIFLVRNGVDVAMSLVERESETSKSFGALIQGNYPRLSVRCWNFDESFALWENYSEIFETQSVAAIPESTQLLRIRYEDLLQEPTQTIARLARFVDLPAEPMVALSHKIDSTRANAYQSSTTGKQEFDKINTSPWMKHYGYVQRKRPLV